MFQKVIYEEKKELDHIKEEYKLANGTTAHKFWKRGALLGKGGQASCYEFTNSESHVKWACKVVQQKRVKHSVEKQKLMTEIKIHKMIKHINIV